jgi:hypothetical protein
MAYAKSGGIIKVNMEGLTPFQAVLAFIVLAAANLAVSGAALMLFTRMVNDAFGFLAPIGFFQAVGLLVLTMLVLAIFRSDE